MKHPSLLTLFLAILIFLASPVRSMTQDVALEDPFVEYLEDRQLKRLVIKHLEHKAAKETDPNRRKQIAKVLVTKYQTYFLSGAAPYDTQQATRKATQLLAEHPELASPKFRLAISHAQFVFAEQEFLNWWSAGALPESRNDINDSFRTVLEELKRQD